MPLDDFDPVCQAVRKYWLFHYGVGASYVGIPRQLVLSQTTLWVFPLVYTTPLRGGVAEVGFIAVDAHSKDVVGTTPDEEVRRAIERVRNATWGDCEFHYQYNELHVGKGGVRTLRVKDWPRFRDTFRSLAAMEGIFGTKRVDDLIVTEHQYQALLQQGLVQAGDVAKARYRKEKL